VYGGAGCDSHSVARQRLKQQSNNATKQQIPVRRYRVICCFVALLLSHARPQWVLFFIGTADRRLAMY
jgi:hypothetical protein